MSVSEDLLHLAEMAGGGGMSFDAVKRVLVEAAERIEADAQDLQDSHAPNGDWTGESLAQAEHDADIRLAARLRLAVDWLEDARARG